MGVDLRFVENRLKIEKSLIKEKKKETTPISIGPAAIKFSNFIAKKKKLVNVDFRRHE